VKWAKAARSISPSRWHKSSMILSTRRLNCGFLF
jgi:hypothetical protein